MSRDKKSPDLPVEIPFIWPEPRYSVGMADYEESPPIKSLFNDANLISGVLVGAKEETVFWIKRLLQLEGEKKICLVLVVFPACATREEHLQTIHDLRHSYVQGQKELEICLLPMSLHYVGDGVRVVFPPTAIQAHNTQTGRTIMNIGSVGNAGFDPAILGSLNFVFQPDDALRDHWRRWFEYIKTISVPLTEKTLHIPHLLPAKGDLKAAQLWEEYKLACQNMIPVEITTSEVSPEESEGTVIEIDDKTGEVKTYTDGKEIPAWDHGKTALDPLAQEVQHVYANGWLVTVDEATRIKPITIPVKATLLGQQAAHTVGSLIQRQSFTLLVLDESVNKAVEKCRKVTDLMDLLTYPLSLGNRWIPDAAKHLLEKELQTRNEQGQKVLRNALGGDDVKKYIDKRTDSICRDLNAMYHQLGQGDAVPDDKLQMVLNEVELRLTQALEMSITPRAVYNRIGPPDLTTIAPDQNWSQPLTLLVRSARILRESLSDSYFPRRLKGLSFTENEFRKACDVFGDVIVKSLDINSAQEELCAIDEIIKSEKKFKEKCKEMWKIVKGDSENSG